MRRTILLLAVLITLGASLSFAQGKKGGEEANMRSVQGTVTDAAGSAVEGAVVQMKNVKSLQIRSFITKDHGQYYFHGLSTDVDYELKAEYQGKSSGSKTLSSFDSRKQAVINLQLK